MTEVEPTIRSEEPVLGRAHSIDEGAVVWAKRFAATPSQGPDEIVDRVADEVHHLRARYGVCP